MNKIVLCMALLLWKQAVAEPAPELPVLVPTDHWAPLYEQVDSNLQARLDKRLRTFFQKSNGGRSQCEIQLGEVSIAKGLLCSVGTCQNSTAPELFVSTVAMPSCSVQRTVVRQRSQSRRSQPEPSLRTPRPVRWPHPPIELIALNTRIDQSWSAISTHSPSRTSLKAAAPAAEI